MYRNVLLHQKIWIIANHLRGAAQHKHRNLKVLTCVPVVVVGMRNGVTAHDDVGEHAGNCVQKKGKVLSFIKRPLTTPPE